MRAGILAAGQGSRLKAGGIAQPKPLVPIQGTPLLVRLLREMEAAAVQTVVCVVNREEGKVIAEVVRSYPWNITVTFLHHTTANSLETFLILLKTLQEGPALFSTVDPIFPAGMLKQFLQRAQQMDQKDGLLAVTEFIDDEKPLYVLLDEHQHILRIGEGASNSRYVTAGLYYFTERIFAEIPLISHLTFPSLRYFLRYLVEQGYRLSAFVAPQIIDVDRPEDIMTAERYLPNA